MSRVRDVQAWQESRPLIAPFRTSLRTVTTATVHMVRVLTDDGRRGVGSAVAATAVTGETDAEVVAALSGPLRDAIVGLPAGDLDLLVSAIQGTAPGCPAARCGVELAVHDLVARAAGVSLAGLLGGADTAQSTAATVSAASGASMASAAEQRRREGFECIKLKVGRDPDGDLERVLAVHAALDGGARLRLDANQGWTLAGALSLLEGLHTRDVDVDYVEQPLPASDLAGMAALTRRSPYPVLADESVFTAHDVAVVADLAAAHAVNLKLLKCGGLSTAAAAAAVAHEAGLEVLVGCMLEGPVGVEAALAFATTLRGKPRTHDLDAAWWLEPQSGDRIVYTPPLVSMRTP